MLTRKKSSINAFDKIKILLYCKDLTIFLLLPLSSCASYSPGANSFASMIFEEQITNSNINQVQYESKYLLDAAEID